MVVVEGEQRQDFCDVLQPENPVEGCSRRHGRFLVQPLQETPLARAASPAGKPPLGPGQIRASPLPSALSERRPSRIIGRFEVSELFAGEPSDSGVSATADLIQELR